MLEPYTERATERRLRERLRRFAAATLARFEPLEHEPATPRRLVEALGRAGFLKLVAARASTRARGGLSAVQLAVCREELAYALPLGDTLFAMQGLGSYPVALAGSERLKRELLPRVAAGRAVTAFALTEPGAGSDAAAIATSARRDGASYVLDGEKRFISTCCTKLPEGALRRRRRAHALSPQCPSPRHSTFPAEAR